MLKGGPTPILRETPFAIPRKSGGESKTCPLITPAQEGVPVSVSGGVGGCVGGRVSGCYQGCVRGYVGGCVERYVRGCIRVCQVVSRRLVL